MRITARQDVEAPIAAVFAAATDHEGFVRQALRRGADVRRTDRGPGFGPGAGWRVSFPFRGREREAAITVDRVAPPTAAAGRVEGGGLAAAVAADFLSLSRGTTRLTLTVDVEGRSLPARLLLQGLRLARGNLERRAAERLAQWAREVEARAGRPAAGGR